MTRAMVRPALRAGLVGTGCPAVDRRPSSMAGALALAPLALPDGLGSGDVVMAQVLDGQVAWRKVAVGREPSWLNGNGPSGGSLVACASTT